LPTHPTSLEMYETLANGIAKKGNTCQSFALILSIFCCYSSQKVFPLQWATSTATHHTHMCECPGCTYVCAQIYRIFVGSIRPSKSAYNLNWGTFV